MDGNFTKPFLLKPYGQKVGELKYIDMTLEKAKQILWADAESMTDEEIQRVIDLIRWICRVVIDEYVSTKFSEDESAVENKEED